MTSRPREPEAWAVVGVSVAALAAGNFGIVAIGALAPDLEADLGLSRAEFGFLTSLVFIGAMITSRRAGKLTDSFGAARVLGLSLAGFAVAMAVAAVAPTTAVFMLAVLAAGLAYGGVNPPTNVVVAGKLARRLGLLPQPQTVGRPARRAARGRRAAARGGRLRLALGVRACGGGLPCGRGRDASLAERRRSPVCEPADRRSPARDGGIWSRSASSGSSCRGRSGRSSPT